MNGEGRRLSSITNKEGLTMEKAIVSVRPENVNKPATSKQLWALYLASKKAGCTHDYRNDNLTMQQASDLLNKFNSENQNVEYKHAIVSSNTIDKLKSYLLVAKQGIVNTMRKDFGIKSIVSIEDGNETRHYGFFGSGCGFAYIDCDKRSKVAREVLRELEDVRKWFINEIVNSFSLEERKEFASAGCALEALLFQSVRFANEYAYAVGSFLIQNGVKGVHIRCFDD